MKQVDYEDKSSLLSDGPYRVLKGDLTLSHERKLIKHLLDLRHCNLLPKKVYYSFHPSGSQIPLFYGLPKIYKVNLPLRPIVAANKSVTYQVAKFLAKLLHPLYGNTDQDSVNFTRSIKTLE